MIIPIDAEKASDKVQQYFMTITLNKLGIEETHLDTIKLNMKSPQLISYSVVKIESVPLKSRTRQECTLPPLPSNTVLEIPA